MRLIRIGKYIGTIFALLCLLCALTGCGPKEVPVLPEGLTVAGVDIGGMNAEKAKAALHQATDGTYTQKAMVLRAIDTRIELSPTESAAALDVEGLVDAAFSEEGLTDWTNFLTLNTDAIRAAVENFAGKFNAAVVQPECRLEAEALLVTLGTPGRAVDEEKLYEAVLEAYCHNTFLVEAEYTMTQPELPDLQPLLNQVYAAPVDAVMDPETFAITPGTDGYGFDLVDANGQLASAEAGQTVTIPLGPISPAVTGEMLLDQAFPDTLSAWQSDCTDSEDRTTNLRLACEAINGKILYPGDVFSYNETLGRRTAEKGYRPAPAYIGNKTVYTRGGGICQVSSALYYCTLIADLEIVYRTYHSYMQTYVPIGMDATVSWGTLDYKFRNDTEHPILIVASVYDSQVHVELRGTDEKDYYVEMEYEVLSTTPYNVLYETYPADNSQGYTNGQVLVEPYAGCQAKTYKCKYDKETGALLSRDYEDYSSYHKRDAVVCQIEGEEDITGKVTFAGSEG